MTPVLPTRHVGEELVSSGPPRSARRCPEGCSPKRGRRQAPPLHALLVILVLAVACTRGSTSARPPIHLNPNMDDQPRYEAQAESDFFADGKAMRQPVPGTVARGELVTAPAFVTGEAGGVPLAEIPIPMDEELLTRGAERYAIYCGPCHAEDGSGRSMLRERSGVATADLTQARLIDASDGYLFDVITNGFGLMPAYSYPIQPRDRWAIVAWVRRLQAEAGPAEGSAPNGAAAPMDAPIEVEASTDAPTEDGTEAPTETGAAEATEEAQ